MDRTKPERRRSRSKSRDSDGKRRKRRKSSSSTSPPRKRSDMRPDSRSSRRDRDRRDSRERERNRNDRRDSRDSRDARDSRSSRYYGRQRTTTPPSRPSSRNSTGKRKSFHDAKADPNRDPALADLTSFKIPRKQRKDSSSRSNTPVFKK